MYLLDAQRISETETELATDTMARPTMKPVDQMTTNTALKPTIRYPVFNEWLAVYGCMKLIVLSETAMGVWD